MALSTAAKQALALAIGTPAPTNEIISAINGGGADSPLTQQTAPVINTVTATSGSLPVPGGSTVIADATAPTVVELLDLGMENRAKIAALIALLHAAGVTT